MLLLQRIFSGSISMAPSGRRDWENTSITKRGTGRSRRSPRIILSRTRRSFGLVLEFCQAGGEVTERLWVPLGTKDFGSIIASLPDDVDAIYLGLGGGDAINFLNQYQQAGGDANLIGGTIMVDPTVLSSKGTAKEAMIGVPSSGPQADTWDDPQWQALCQGLSGRIPARRALPVSLAARNRILQCDERCGRLYG